MKDRRCLKIAAPRSYSKVALYDDIDDLRQLTSIQAAEQLSNKLPFLRSAHQQTEAFAHCPSCPAISVNIDICGTGYLVVDDMVDGRDI